MITVAELAERVRGHLTRHWPKSSATSDGWWLTFAKDVEATLKEAEASAGAPIAAHHKAHGLTPEAIVAHYPQSQHQPDECEMCDAIHKIAAEALGGVK